ncbi:hypothetical protein [Devosia epidermidihirudinis]|uniref:hypothetical protein n=1 Tax=Devosia epidermidihirudinis TaxID=1293439 RepID=UPI0006960C19|nr:hypothetical protein [Devosia epidermidihirudinis]
MTGNLALIVETGALILAAYLLGCIVAYAARRTLFAMSKARVAVPATLVETPVRRPPTPAARLAATVDHAPLAPIPQPILIEAPAEVLVAAASARPKPKPRAKARPKTEVVAKAVRKLDDPKPAALLRPRKGKADDLKQIKGIGPKIEASLNGLGVYHFDQIAAWTKLNIDWVDGQLAFKGRIRREQWVEQATALAAR